MLDRAAITPASLAEDTPPLLIVVIDTEEEFDWTRPLSRESTGTRSIGAQDLAQEVFTRHGVVPTYVVDYPVATSARACRLLKAYADDGRCEIGAHLHPWVNPPHEEAVTWRNSYAGNLPKALERAKLLALTQAIEANLGRRPTIYKAGRYGVGPNSAALLQELGYKIDLSVVAKTSFTDDGGPDFSAFDFRPYWFGANRDLLEIPLSASYAGFLGTLGPALFPPIRSRLGCSLHLPEIAARLRLLERIRLTPEGIDLAALKRLTRTLLGQGCRVFCMAYHSPSLQPGFTPYVSDDAELEAFLGTIEGYIRYFIDELGGRPATPTGLYDLLAAEAPAEVTSGAEGQGAALST
ncbi:MAG: glycosyltransferase [Rhizobiales bacterium]|nr:glycosyltransferase [Hyphomicrobiales bacterium]